MEALKGLLANKWVLYGGAALAALGVVWYMSSGASVSEETGDAISGALFPTGGNVILPASSQNAAGMDLGGLIALESMKAEFGREVSLAEIDATLKSSLASSQTGLALGLRQAETLDLMTMASIYGDASKLLTGYIGTVGASMVANGKTYSFDAFRSENRAGAGESFAGQNVSSLLSSYHAVNRTGIANAGPSSVVSSSPGQLQIASSPSSRSAGVPDASIAALGSSVGSSSPATSVDAVARRRKRVKSVPAGDDD